VLQHFKKVVELRNQRVGSEKDANVMLDEHPAKESSDMDQKTKRQDEREGLVKKENRSESPHSVRQSSGPWRLIKPKRHP
jgi:hypothetical protein